jgi:heme exporter protein C
MLTCGGLFWGVFLSPADYQQGDAVRIMYIHVPFAWLATAGYASLALASFMSIVWRHPLADMAAAEIGPVGAAATALCLATGSLWGKPMWGAWWVWDARLTSVLVLFFLYCGHIMLIRAFDDMERGARAGAILAMVGVVNLPIIRATASGSPGRTAWIAACCGRCSSPRWGAVSGLRRSSPVGCARR